MVDPAHPMHLRIYFKLLVHGSPVLFGAHYGPCAPHLIIRAGSQRLNPALLCVNKMANREAIPSLYSDNHFRFPNEYTSLYTATGPTRKYHASQRPLDRSEPMQGFCGVSLLASRSHSLPLVGESLVNTSSLSRYIPTGCSALDTTPSSRGYFEVVARK